MEMEIVPRVAAPSPAELQRGFVDPGRPVVLSGVLDAWADRARWSIEHLAAARGVRVPVARTRGGEVITDSGRGLVFDEVPLGEVVASLQRGEQAGYVMARLDQLPAHLRREAPALPYGEGAPWRVAKLWISAPGTTTALHFDMADNVHVVIAGRKRFILIDPGQSDCVYPRGILSDLPNGAEVDPSAPDLARFPRFVCARPMVADVGPGETIFIPRRYWHHVRTVELTLAVNVWWAEGARALLARAADAFKRARGLSR
jgi:oxalate decarboxylase/phosphoglucose isomerase-like protein (cupin superfamily)